MMSLKKIAFGVNATISGHVGLMLWMCLLTGMSFGYASPDAGLGYEDYELETYNETYTNSTDLSELQQADEELGIPLHDRLLAMSTGAASVGMSVGSSLSWLPDTVFKSGLVTLSLSTIAAVAYPVLTRLRRVSS